MQVGGDVGTLLGPDPLGPLRAQVGGQPEHPGADHDAEARDAEAARQER